MKQLIKMAKYISIIILAISVFGCEEDDNNYPKVVAGFTRTIDQEARSVTFINTSTEATDYLWTFGDGISSRLINPVKTYAEGGTYPVALKASNGAGESNTFNDTIVIQKMVSLPITFDDAMVLHMAEPFNGASFQVVDNPDVSGTNNVASMVGAIINSGAQWEGISFNLGTAIDLTADKTITMNFWAQNDPVAPMDVLLKLEDGTGADTEISVTHGGTGWETLSFVLTSSDSYSKLTLFVDGPGTTTGSFFIDDIMQINSGPVITLIGDATVNVAVGDTFTDPGATATDDVDGDISANIVVAGDTVDVNTEATYTITYNVTNAAGIAAPEVTRDVVVTAAAADTVAPVITLTGSANMNVTVGGTFTDPGATALDDIDGDITSNIVVAGDTVDVNTAGTYTITYNVMDAAGNAAVEVTREVIVAAVVACTDTLLALPIDFDCAGIDYESKRVAGGIGFSIIDNPQLSGVNTVASKVGEIVNIGDNWENLNFTLDTPIDFSTDKSIKLKLYSTVNVVIKLKVETGGTPVENDQTHGGTGWEELTFTLPTSDSFSNIVVFIDGPGITKGTFYIDDIVQVASGGGGGGGPVITTELATNGDFETGDTSGWATFVTATGASFEASSVEPSTGSFSGNLVSDFDAGIGGAVDAVVKQANLGAGGGATPNTEYVVSFDLRGSANTGGVFFVEFFSELSDGGTSKAEIITGGPHPLSNTWTSYSYTVLTGSDVSGGITLQLKTSCGSVEGCLVDVYFDNVSIILKP